MAWDLRGIIEGFYGRPWTWDERILVGRWCAERGMTHYVYAPKDDPLHRERWRDPYPNEDLDQFARYQAEGGLGLGFALSPGLSIDYDDAEDRRALLAKVRQLTDLGVDLVCLALDDIPPRPGLGDAHAALTTWLRGELPDGTTLVLVPTEYTGARSTAYLDALAEGVPVDVPIAWTGETVVCDTITVAQARRRADALGGRSPLVWENYPVNDTVMADRLFLGPLRGRDPDLGEHCSGYLANPMTQPRASLLPLASVAGYLRGDDPDQVWAAEADALGIRTLAEACDGAHPRALVAELAASLAASLAEESAGDHTRWIHALAALRAWIEAAATCGAPGLADEADRWVQQTHTEASAALTAVRVLERVRPNGRGRERDLPAASELALLAGMQWQACRRGEVSVFGPRCSLRPVMSQDDAGQWVFHAESVQEDQNALDALLRLAIAALDAVRGDPPPSGSEPRT